MIQSKIGQLLNKRFARYLIVGGAGFLLEIVVILVAQLLGASPVLAVSIGYWVGTIVAFFMQKLLAFDDKRMHHRILLPQMLATALLILINFGFTVVLTRLLEEYLPATVIRTIALAITMVWNFFLYKTIIFRQPT